MSNFRGLIKNKIDHFSKDKDFYISEIVWTLIEKTNYYQKRIMQFDKLDSEGYRSDEDQRRQKAIVSSLAHMVYGGAVYNRSISINPNRRRFTKPTVREKYKLMLSHVALCCLSQYAHRAGFIENRNGKKVIQEIDITFHFDDIFTSEVDMKQIMDSWNEKNIGKSIPSVDAFLKTCKRAIIEFDRSKEPYPTGVKQAVFCSLDKEKEKKKERERLSRLREVFNTAKIVKAVWKLDGNLSVAQWKQITQIHNNEYGTKYAIARFRSIYVEAADMELQQPYDPISELSDTIDIYYKRRSRTEEEYVQNLEQGCKAYLEKRNVPHEIEAERETNG